MKTIKKILLGIISTITPLITLACTRISNPEAEINKIKKELLPIHKSFIKKSPFIPLDWLENQYLDVKEHRQQKYIKDDGTQDSINFNSEFFDNFPKDPSNKFNNAIKISSKNQFDKYIIERFKELHNFKDFNNNFQIKKLFEELYLDNQDVYKLLENNDIYIWQHFSLSNAKWNEQTFVIPLYDKNKVTLFFLRYHVPLTSNSIIPGVYPWEVFVLPKNYEIKIKYLEFEKDESGLNYLYSLEKWYYRVYKSYYK